MLKTYLVKIKEVDSDQIQNLKLSANAADFYIDVCSRMNLMQQLHEDFERNFLRVTNQVVELGGVLDIKLEDLNYDWKIFVNEIKVKIPDDSFLEIKNNPYVESIERLTPDVSSDQDYINP